MWLVLAGSLIGCLVEMCWYRHLRGKWMSRKGVIYGPFSPIYGVALAGFLYLFYPMRRKSLPFLFALGACLGSAFEYACGYLQEKILGTKSWDYSKKKFQLHGRICLEFAVYWGIAAVAAVRLIYPILSRVVESFSQRRGPFIVGGLFVLFLADCLISIAACVRQRFRREGKEAVTALEQFLDRHYPDERLAELFTEIRVAADSEFDPETDLETELSENN
ncbi:MAG: putative ABC transporter permease [bacterium]|nr:putative ABC transporter permease [bacterium]